MSAFNSGMSEEFHRQNPHTKKLLALGSEEVGVEGVAGEPGVCDGVFTGEMGSAREQLTLIDQYILD